jgi:hypothetical protein
MTEIEIQTDPFIIHHQTHLSPPISNYSSDEKSLLDIFLVLLIFRNVMKYAFGITSDCKIQYTKNKNRTEKN